MKMHRLLVDLECDGVVSFPVFGRTVFCISLVHFFVKFYSPF